VPAGAAPTIDPVGSGGEQTVVVWTSGGLPPDAADALGAVPAVDAVAIVRGDLVEVVRTEREDGAVVDEPSDGRVIPIDAVAVDPQAYAAVLPVASSKAVAGLEADQVLLGETSARVRRLGIGGAIVVAGGRRYTVAAVLPDRVVAGAEVVFTTAGGALAGVDTERFALVVSTGDRVEVEAALHRAVPGARVRGPAETPFLRHGDAVLTQAQIKDRYGELTYRRALDGSLEIDPAWTAANLVSVELPLVGAATCHRAIVDALASALRELEQDGLGHLVDPRSFGGCWNPRLIGEDQALSRHAWGLAVDLNVAKNPTGLDPAIDPRVVDAFERAGFTWGGTWLVPDAAHFEVRDLRIPRPR
jgi:hypothetical protein